MSTPVSHKGFEIHSFPEHAITPEILYLHIGDNVPAAAVAASGGWKVVIFGTDDDVVEVGRSVGDVQAAREWLETYGQAAVA